MVHDKDQIVIPGVCLDVSAGGARRYGSDRLDRGPRPSASKPDQGLPSRRSGSRGPHVLESLRVPGTCPERLANGGCQDEDGEVRSVRRNGRRRDLRAIEGRETTPRRTCALIRTDGRWFVRVLGWVPLTSSSRKRWALSLTLTLFGTPDWV